MLTGPEQKMGKALKNFKLKYFGKYVLVCNLCKGGKFKNRYFKVLKVSFLHQDHQMKELKADLIWYLKNSKRVGWNNKSQESFYRKALDIHAQKQHTALITYLIACETFKALIQ